MTMGNPSEGLLARLVLCPTRYDLGAALETGPEPFEQALTAHGIGPLVYRGLHAARLSNALPAAMLTRLRRLAANAEALEWRRQSATNRLLDLLTEGGIRPLLIKGGGLGPWLYASPGLRARMDTDLLIPEEHGDLVHRMLSDNGYRIAHLAENSHLNYQFCALITDDAGICHAFDIHHRISNRELFARALRYPELIERAIPLPDLSPHALTLNAVDALLLACMHRVAHSHHGEPERLIWLYDIHLLVESLDQGQVATFNHLAREKGLAAVGKDGIERAGELFGTRIPPPMSAILDQPLPKEPAAKLLRAGPVASLWHQFNELGTWPRRLEMLRELAFPSRQYMKRKYPRSRLWLPLLYMKRAGEGIVKRTRRSGVKGNA